MIRTTTSAGLVAGVLATAAFAALLYLASALLNISFVPYDLADLVIRLTPGQIATAGIETLGVLAKLSVKLGSVALFVLLGGGLGAAIGWARARRGVEAVPLARAMAAVALFAIMLVIARLNWAATRTSPLQPVPLLTLLALAIGWGYGLSYLLRRLAPAASPIVAADPPTADVAPPVVTDADRRAFLLRSGATVLTIAVGSTALAELFRQEATGVTGPSVLPAAVAEATEQPVDLSGFQAPPGVRPRITPQDELYYVSSRVRDPRIDPAEYALRIEGNVERPLQLTLDQLQRLPRVEQTSTLQCISNEVGGELIGNCTWNGTRLSDLLAEAGLRPGSQRVVLYGADGYVDSIDLADALKPTTLLVYGIDGAPLTVPHGYPMRLIVPNIYGMKNVKWLQRIDVVTFDFQGYWQERGWSNPAVVKTTSVVDTAGTLSLEGGVVPLGGIAFAGSRGVQAVEVQIDGGAWQAATLEPESSALQWRRWRWDWPATPGAHTVRVRASDGDGALQTEVPADPHPDGASGYHAIRVRVRG